MRIFSFFLLVLTVFCSIIKLDSQDNVFLSISPAQFLSYKVTQDINFTPRVKATFPVLKKGSNFLLNSGLGVQIIKRARPCLILLSSLHDPELPGFAVPTNGVCEYSCHNTFLNVFLPIDFIFFIAPMGKKGLLIRVSNNTTLYNSKIRKYSPFDLFNLERKYRSHTFLNPLFVPEIALGYRFRMEPRAILTQLYFHRRTEDATFNAFGFEVTIGL